MHAVAIRWFRRLSVCLIGLSVAHVALADPPPALPHVAARIAAQGTLRITAFGSSSTEGIGATSKDRCYPVRLQAALESTLPKGVSVVVMNRGIGGEDVDDMMARLPAIIAEKPDLVIWQTGSNDSLRSVKLPHAGRGHRRDADGAAAVAAPGAHGRLRRVPDGGARDQRADACAGYPPLRPDEAVACKRHADLHAADVE
jgi:hypothetical protein